MSVPKVSIPMSAAVLLWPLAGTGTNSSKLLDRICVDSWSLSCLKSLAYISRGNGSFCRYSDILENLYAFCLLQFNFVG